MKKILEYKIGDIKIDISTPENDSEWIKLLLINNREPFKTLKQLGFHPYEREAKDQA
jgi:hypothetical protein